MEFSNKFNNFIKTNKKLYWMDDVSGETKIDLSLSENPLGCSPLVMDTIIRAEYSVSKYPEPTNLKLKKALALELNLSCSNIVIGTGIGPLIDSLFRGILDQKSEVIIPMVTFPLIEQLVRLNHGKPVLVKMNNDLTINIKNLLSNVSKRTKAVFICNPNNPTGELLSRETILNLAKEISPILLIVDEANIEFGGQSAASDIRKFDNLVVARTFSKGFGLAGLRIGFMVASTRIARMIEQITIPFEINSISTEATLAALKDKQFLIKTKTMVQRERNFLVKELEKRNFEIVPGKILNILVRVDKVFESSTTLFKLLANKGIKVVNGNGFLGLEESFIRISPRTREASIGFIRVIDELLEGGRN